MSTRGKTTPDSTGGSYKPATGQKSRVGIPAAADDIAAKAGGYASALAATGRDHCPHCRAGSFSADELAEHLASVHPHLTPAAPATYAAATNELGQACAAGSLGWIINKPSLKRLKEFVVDAANANPNDTSWVSFAAIKDGCDPRGGSVRHQVMRAACDTAFRFARAAKNDPAASPRAIALGDAITTINPTRLYSGTRDTHKVVKADMTERAAEWAASPYTELQELARVISPDTRGGPWADQVLSSVGRAVTALTYEISN